VSSAPCAARGLPHRYQSLITVFWKIGSPVGSVIFAGRCSS
jgi:hypothetical protein